MLIQNLLSPHCGAYHVHFCVQLVDLPTIRLRLDTVDELRKKEDIYFSLVEILPKFVTDCDRLWFVRPLYLLTCTSARLVSSSSQTFKQAQLTIKNVVYLLEIMQLISKLELKQILQECTGIDVLS